MRTIHFDYKRELTESFEYYNTMKNGSISEQVNMQERQIADERKDTDMQTGLHADKQEELTEHKIAYKHDDNLSNIQSVNQENKKEDKQSVNLPDLGLSSVLGLLTPDANKEDEQIPMKKKIKKKPKRGRKR